MKEQTRKESCFFIVLNLAIQLSPYWLALIPHGLACSNWGQAHS